MKYLVLTAIFLGLFSSGVEARQRHVSTGLHPMCNILWPCIAPTSPSAVRENQRVARGKYVARELGIGGVAPKRHALRSAPVTRRAVPVVQREATIVEHPAGCPRSAFCACGAAVRLLGSARAAPWLARAWYAFKRTVAAPHMAGVRPHHVIALEYQVSGNMWMVYDANSGGRATRLHVIDISPYTIVNPRS